MLNAHQQACASDSTSQLMHVPPTISQRLSKHAKAIATTLPRLERQSHWVCHRKREATATLREFLQHVDKNRAAA